MMVYKILVVEDQEEISDIVSKYISREGYDVIVANNGFEALEYFNKQAFHLILLDIMMPGINGFEVLKEIRKISDIPVIMLTAKQEEIDKLKGFNIGADDYVVKPFSPRELMKRYARLGNGVETVPSNLRLNYHLEKIPRGKQRGNFFFGCKVTALNFKKLFNFRKGLGHYALNPVIA